MTLADAQAAAGNLRTALLDHGVRAVSIELQQGVSTSGWGVAPFKRGLGHHIVSRPPGTPGLALVKKGRPDLAGPLCNGYGGYDLVARIITMGWANHPGLGGPWSLPGWGTVPQDNGRPYIFGWEFEGGIDPYTDEMHDFMARCGAGTLDWLGTLPGNPGSAPLECWGEHKTWAPGRKVDRLGYTTESGRARIAAVRDGDDMPLTDADVTRVAKAVLDMDLGGGVTLSRFAKTAAGDTATAVLGRPIKRQGELSAARWGAGSVTTLEGLIAWNDEANLAQGLEMAKAVAEGSAADVAAAIPADLARQVADELGKRLNS